MKNSFDLDLKVEPNGQQVEPDYTITLYQKICTITAVGCGLTQEFSACQGTRSCDTVA